MPNINYPLSEMCIIGKKHSIYKVQYYLWFQAPIRGLRTYPPQIREDYYNSARMISLVSKGMAW